MPHMIEIEHLWFVYPDGREVLRDISMSMQPGEKVAVVGPNGAGKSTLLLHLNGILRPQRGTVRVCGLDVGENRSLAAVRAAVGFVFQESDDQLFSPTVFDDVAYGLIYRGCPEDEVLERVAAALTAVEMESYTHRVSYRLSPGEKKRIALATVLAMNPKILVLDEPTGGLDPRGRRNFTALLRKLPQTMLVATHDMTLVRNFFHRTVVLNEGRVVADDLTKKVLGSHAFLEAHGLV